MQLAVELVLADPLPAVEGQDAIAFGLLRVRLRLKLGQLLSRRAARFHLGVLLRRQRQERSRWVADEVLDIGPDLRLLGVRVHRSGHARALGVVVRLIVLRAALVVAVIGPLALVAPRADVDGATLRAAHQATQEGRALDVAMAPAAVLGEPALPPGPLPRRPQGRPPPAPHPPPPSAPR